MPTIWLFDFCLFENFSKIAQVGSFEWLQWYLCVCRFLSCCEHFDGHFVCWKLWEGSFLENGIADELIKVSVTKFISFQSKVTYFHLHDSVRSDQSWNLSWMCVTVCIFEFGINFVKRSNAYGANVLHSHFNENSVNEYMSGRKMYTLMPDTRHHVCALWCRSLKSEFCACGNQTEMTKICNMVTAIKVRYGAAID